MTQINYNDLQSLDTLRASAQKDDKAALKEVAQQFEGIFTQMLFKSMRQANAAFETDSPFNNKQTKYYQDMQDNQMSAELSQNGSLGLADLIVQQLSPSDSKNSSAGFIRSDQLKNRLINTSALTASSSVNKIATNVADTQKISSLSEPAEFQNQQSFVDALMPMAKKAAKLLGLEPAVLLAQSALETGWGKKVLTNTDGSSSHNLFNIKTGSQWEGDKVAVETTEYKEGVALRQKADFRSYQDYKKSFNDYVDLLNSSSRYKKAIDKSSDSAGFLQELQKAGYATDPKYADKVFKVFEQITDMASK